MRRLSFKDSGFLLPLMQQVTTNVIVPDGATLVIGGLMDQEIENCQADLPWLSRLPVVSAIFRFSEKRCVKKEPIVLLTTHLWDPHLGPTLESCPLNPPGEIEPIPPGPDLPLPCALRMWKNDVGELLSLNARRTNLKQRC